VTCSDTLTCSDGYVKISGVLWVSGVFHLQRPLRFFRAPPSGITKYKKPKNAGTPETPDNEHSRVRIFVHKLTLFSKTIGAVDLYEECNILRLKNHPLHAYTQSTQTYF
jgi:hypothetical protein